MTDEAEQGDQARREALLAEHAPEQVRRRLEGDAAPHDLGDALLGGIDGAVTTFAVVSGVMGGNLPLSVAVLLGFANLVADGFSMAASNYESTRSDALRVERLRRQEQLHIRLVPDGEREEIRQIFARKGFEEPVLSQIVEGITRDPSLWVETMLREEHGEQVQPRSAVRAALVTFVAFVVVGAIPLLPLLAPWGAPATRFGVSLGATLAMFALIGALKGRLLGVSVARASLGTLMTGGAAAFLSWGVGRLIHAWVSSPPG